MRAMPYAPTQREGKQKSREKEERKRARRKHDNDEEKSKNQHKVMIRKKKEKIEQSHTHRHTEKEKQKRREKVEERKKENILDIDPLWPCVRPLVGVPPSVRCSGLAHSGRRATTTQAHQHTNTPTHQHTNRSEGGKKRNHDEDQEEERRRGNWKERGGPSHTHRPMKKETQGKKIQTKTPPPLHQPLSFVCLPLLFVSDSSLSRHIHQSSAGELIHSFPIPVTLPVALLLTLLKLRGIILHEHPFTSCSQGKRRERHIPINPAVEERRSFVSRRVRQLILCLWLLLSVVSVRAKEKASFQPYPSVQLWRDEEHFFSPRARKL